MDKQIVDSDMDEQVSKMRTIIFKQYVTLGDRDHGTIEDPFS